MNRGPLLSLLHNHEPSDEAEREMWENIIEFVKENEDCFERTLRQGHLTASAWIVSPDRNQVLLMEHRKLMKWFQPGGHCDGDPDVLAVALKETQEETGVKARPVSFAIFDVDVHLIPANTREDTHYHYDIRFLLEADPADVIERNSESREVRWVPLAEVPKYNPSESIVRMQRKILTTSL
jgi:8-oxo-dGTP pyrophosphatase MutT (NUDIX family)